MRRFSPNASLVADDPAFARRVEQVVSFMEHPARQFDLPLDIQGTVFQQQVWQALRAIPPGDTVSYQVPARQTSLQSLFLAIVLYVMMERWPVIAGAWSVNNSF